MESVGNITAVFRAGVSVFAPWGFVWATVFVFANALSVALNFVPFTTESTFRNAFLSGFTTNFAVVAAAVLNTSVILVLTVESWGITAWLFSWPAFTMAVNFMWTTTENISAWLAVLGEVRAAHIRFVLTAASFISIVVSLEHFI